jgi:hypothetical protein
VIEAGIRKMKKGRLAKGCITDRATIDALLVKDMPSRVITLACSAWSPVPVKTFYAL